MVRSNIYGGDSLARLRLPLLNQNFFLTSNWGATGPVITLREQFDRQVLNSDGTPSGRFLSTKRSSPRWTFSLPVACGQVLQMPGNKPNISTSASPFTSTTTGRRGGEIGAQSCFRACSRGKQSFRRLFRSEKACLNRRLRRRVTGKVGSLFLINGSYEGVRTLNFPPAPPQPP